MTHTVPDPADTETSAADRRTARAATLADGLRKLAAFVDANPDLASDLVYSFDSINVPHIEARGDAKQYLAKYARAGVRSGAKVEKNFTIWGSVIITFADGVALHVYADRAEVCERVVTGTREVTEEVPDPQALAAVPKVAVTKVIEDVEWVCSPLLAEAGADR